MNDERAREGVEHLQTAALELIEAARAFLDVAEDVVRDPSELVALAETVARVVAVARPRSDGARSAAEPRVQRIHVS